MKLAGLDERGIMVTPCALSGGVSCASASSRARVVSECWRHTGWPATTAARPPHHHRIARAQRRRLAYLGDIADGHRRLAAHRQHAAAIAPGSGAGIGDWNQHPLMGEIDKTRAAQGQGAPRRVRQVCGVKP